MRDNLLQKARNLRKNQTEAEKLLWRQLRNRRLGGYKFRRQCPMGQYIADFVCEARKLIVEVDGGQHAESVDADELRTQILFDRGYSVLRFWNNDIFQNTEGVLQSILAELNGK